VDLVNPEVAAEVEWREAMATTAVERPTATPVTLGQAEAQEMQVLAEALVIPAMLGQVIGQVRQEALDHQVTQAGRLPTRIRV